MNVEMLCLQLRDRCRTRTDYHKAEKSLTLEMKAICRRHCDGDKTVANERFKAMEKLNGSAVDPLAPLLVPLFASRAPVMVARNYQEEQIKELARSLPVWPWIRDEVKGCSDLLLGLIVGAACGSKLITIGDYPTPAKLWKRFGVGLVDGERQRKHIDEALAEKHGYSPLRRSTIWVAGDCLIKAGESGSYYQLYADRKAYLTERGWCGKCRRKGEKGDREVCIPGHLHNSAKRFMEKRFLLNLWQEWKRVS
jgi:hypothetical protein